MDEISTAPPLPRSDWSVSPDQRPDAQKPEWKGIGHEPLPADINDPMQDLANNERGQKESRWFDTVSRAAQKWWHKIDDYELDLKKPREKFERANTEALVAHARVEEMQKELDSAQLAYADGIAASEEAVANNDSTAIRNANNALEQLKKNLDNIEMKLDKAQALSIRKAEETQRLKQPIETILDRELNPLDQRLADIGKDEQVVVDELSQLPGLIAAAQMRLDRANGVSAKLIAMSRRGMSREELTQWSRMRAAAKMTIRANTEALKDLKDKERKGALHLSAFKSRKDAVMVLRNRAIRIARGSGAPEARAEKSLTALTIPRPSTPTLSELLAQYSKTQDTRATIAAATETDAPLPELLARFHDVDAGIVRWLVQAFLELWNTSFDLKAERAFKPEDVPMYDDSGKRSGTLADVRGELTFDQFQEHFTRAHALDSAFRQKVNASNAGPLDIYQQFDDMKLYLATH